MHALLTRRRLDALSTLSTHQIPLPSRRHRRRVQRTRYMRWGAHFELENECRLGHAILTQRCRQPSLALHSPYAVTGPCPHRGANPTALAQVLDPELRSIIRLLPGHRAREFDGSSHESRVFKQQPRSLRAAEGCLEGCVRWQVESQMVAGGFVRVVGIGRRRVLRVRLNKDEFLARGKANCTASRGAGLSEYPTAHRHLIEVGHAIEDFRPEGL
mmetsp:Transcript_17943/g.58695  ORF Transcript_17943/g.58695 Transcript_17943/m.58695 type:complete len:215 (-) Transcript_17943:592-1236(-)|eukprot:scaffold28261_cov112-Isochrysis_galbana.AAC.2